MANLSQERRERMLAFLQTLKAQHTDDDSLMALGEIEKELKAKKYGLVWEEHEEEVDVKMRTHIPVFTADDSMEIDGDPSSERFNFLLEGDNLHSLRLLEKTHRGRIDLIYIDPPYNTGSQDFRYDDAFVDKQDGFRHSKWISFMYERLVVAKRLMSAKGVIFISIDDNECAQLKMLCDEIFGEVCFVGDISWQRTYSPRNDSLGLSAEVEHILAYSKTTEWTPKKLKRTEKMDSIYKSPDGDPKPWTSSSLTAPGASTHQGMVYAIQHPITGVLMYPTAGRHWALGQEQMLENMQVWAKYKLQVLDDDVKRADICTIPVEQIRTGIGAIVLDEDLKTAKAHATEILTKGSWPYFYFTSNGKGGLRRKTYLSENAGRMPTNYWPFSEVGHTDGAKKELKAIFSGSIPFDTPKPTSLIKRVLEIASNEDSIILDFFAGSGTTGQAVMELNRQDGGKRSFILCTNNENDICETVTYQRLKTVITGKRQDGSEYSEGIPANLMYFRTDFVDKESEELSEELLEHIREMIQLEHGIKIDDQKYVIIMDDEEMDAFEQNFSNYTQLKAVFINQDVFLSSSQEEMLESVDSYIIPDYYFDFELREAGEIW